MIIQSLLYTCTDTQNGSEVYVKSWKEYWFLAEPSSFILTHMPIDKGTIATSLQHTEKPVNNPKQWAESAIVSPQAGVFGIKPTTHPSALIKTNTGQVIIQFLCEFPLQLSAKVSRVETKADPTIAVATKYWDIYKRDRDQIASGSAIDNTVALFTSKRKYTMMT